MDIKIYQNSLTIIYRNLIREDIAVGTNAVKITRRSLKFEIVMEVWAGYGVMYIMHVALLTSNYLAYLPSH